MVGVAPDWLEAGGRGRDGGQRRCRKEEEKPAQGRSE
jgi:hypothetical protein